MHLKENCFVPKFELMSSLLCTNFQGWWRLESLVVGVASSLIRCKALLNELQRRFQSDERRKRGPILLSRKEEDDLWLMGLMGLSK